MDLLGGYVERICFDQRYLLMVEIYVDLGNLVDHCEQNYRNGLMKMSTQQIQTLHLIESLFSELVILIHGI